MTIDDKTLMQWVDGEVHDPTLLKTINSAVGDNRELQAKVDHLRMLRGLTRQALANEALTAEPQSTPNFGVVESRLNARKAARLKSRVAFAAGGMALAAVVLLALRYGARDKATRQDTLVQEDLSGAMGVDLRQARVSPEQTHNADILNFERGETTGWIVEPAIATIIWVEDAGEPASEDNR